jgi:hypothetical protein
MYEITVIESHAGGTLLMAHIPCNDDDVEYVSGDLIEQENKAVASGIVTAYTTITNYFPNRDAFLHYVPQRVIEVTP